MGRFVFAKVGKHCFRTFLTVVTVLIASVAHQSSTVAQDCNTNGIDDACDIDCGTTGGACDIPNCGGSADCNGDGVPDECELGGTFLGKLTPADGAAGDQFGLGAASDGEFAVIGSRWDDDFGAQSGSAYVYQFLGNAWQFHSKLTASDAAAIDLFGYSVAISGHTILIGAYGDDDHGEESGSAYVFSYDGNVWQQSAKLVASDAGAFDRFGWSVALDGDVALVSAIRDDEASTDAGAAYVYRNSGGVWTQEAKLRAADAEAFDNFGFSVGLDGSTAIIGAAGNDDNGTNSGSAYVFEDVGGIWQQVDKLIAADAGFLDNFGEAVAVDSGLIVVAARLNDIVNPDSGSVYCFRFNGAHWEQQLWITGFNNSASDQFGFSVATYQGLVAVAAIGDDDQGSSSGSVELIRVFDDSFERVTKLTATDGAPNDQFGVAVAIGANGIVIGASLDDDNGNDSGSAYFYDNPAALDCNANSIPDICELATSDCNANGVPDDCDVFLDTTIDCNQNGLPDTCDLAAGTSFDCNGNEVLDECDILSDLSIDCDGNGVPDVCDLINEDLDCNNNGVLDVCDADVRESDFFAPIGFPANNYFEAQIAFGNALVAVGAPAADDAGVNAGWVRVFRLIDAQWQFETTLIPDDLEPWSRLGTQVLVAGDTIFASTVGDDFGSAPVVSGSVYVFREVAGQWQQIDRLFADTENTSRDLFGSSLAFDGETLVVGAPEARAPIIGAGAVYLFRELDGQWQQVGQVLPAQPKFNAEFGASVAIDDGLIVVGAPDYPQPSGRGAVYIFEQVAGSWQQQPRINAPSPPLTFRFGRSVATNGSDIAVAAENTTVVRIYRKTNESWELVTELSNDGNTADDDFGGSLRFSGRQLLVGAESDSEAGVEAGAVYLYGMLDDQWQLMRKLIGSQVGVRDDFGRSIATFANQAVILAPRVNIDAELGAFFTYDLPEATDCNLNGVLDTCELTIDMGVDCNNNGLPDSCDLDCNDNGVPDDCELVANPAHDCNANGVPDTCDFAVGAAIDCNGNGLPDACDIASQTESDCDADGVPDGCELDCNLNGVADPCDILSGTSTDCNGNGFPDDCDLNNALFGKFFASDGSAGSRFGFAIALNGATAVVGANEDDAQGFESGAAYIFGETEGAWRQQTKLVAATTAASDRFGHAVAIEGNTVIVGAPHSDIQGSDAGLAYVFRRTGDIWQEIRVLVASDADLYDNFGYAVGVSDGVFAIGAPFDNDFGDDSGSVYLRKLTGSSSTQIAKLNASDAQAGDLFGSRLTISGDTLVVSAVGDDEFGDGSGAVYVFQEVSFQNWQQVAKLTADDAATGDLFGTGVAIHDHTLLIGANNDDEHGSAYIFEDIAGSWVQTAKLVADDAEFMDFFGSGVAIQDDVAVIGAPWDDDNGTATGSLYVYRNIEGTWTNTEKLNANDPGESEAFGTSPVIGGPHLLTAAVNDSELGLNAGSVYAFRLQNATDCNSNGLPDQCESDCNGNQVPDDCDLVNQTSADCNINQIPDDCEDDCNGNAIPDDCDIANQTSADCNANDIIDSCEIANEIAEDCNANGVPDECDLANQTSSDCNANGLIDSCDIAQGTSDDCNLNEIPDDCELAGNDSDGNGIPDDCLVINLTRGTAHLTIPAAIAAAEDFDLIQAAGSRFSDDATIDYAGKAIQLSSTDDIVQEADGAYTLANAASLATALGGTADLSGRLDIPHSATTGVSTGALVMQPSSFLLLDDFSELSISADSAVEMLGSIEVRRSGRLASNAPLNNRGRLEFMRSSIDVPVLSNDPAESESTITGEIFGRGTIGGDLVNRSTALFTGPSRVEGDCVNTQFLRIECSFLRVFGNLSNENTIVGDFSGGNCCECFDVGFLVGGDYTAAATATMSMVAGSFRLGGNFDTAIDDHARYIMDTAELRFNGTGFVPQTMEVMSADIGPSPAGLDRSFPGHYPIQTLSVEPTAIVSLIDNHDNDGLGQAGCEAIYVNELVVAAGATLNTGTCRVYYESLTLNGDVDDPGNLIEIIEDIPGDIDGNGDVDQLDGVALAAVLVDAPLDPSHIPRSDLNDDGETNGLDIQSFVALVTSP